MDGWDKVFDSYPTAEKLKKYRQPKAISSFNVVLGRDIGDRSAANTAYCKCQRCKPMHSSVEAFCCRDIANAQTLPASNFLKYLNGECICDDGKIKAVVENKDELEIFIQTVKGYSGADDEDAELMSG